MADTKHTGAISAAAPTNVAGPDEGALRVNIRPRRLDFWEYEGTRAQLEAEGVIPPGTEWPEGAHYHRWDAGSFRFWLRRCRPEGIKGPMKIWSSGDWWRLRCDLLNGPDHATRSILEKKAELAAELYRHSAVGQRESNARWARYWKACDDKAFQAFKELIPGLVPPPRGRRSKTSPPAA